MVQLTSNDKSNAAAFEMCFAPSTFGAGGPNQTTSRIQMLHQPEHGSNCVDDWVSVQGALLWVLLAADVEPGWRGVVEARVRANPGNLCVTVMLCSAMKTIRVACVGAWRGQSTGQSRPRQVMCDLDAVFCYTTRAGGMY